MHFPAQPLQNGLLYVRLTDGRLARCDDDAYLPTSLIIKGFLLRIPSYCTSTGSRAPYFRSIEVGLFNDIGRGDVGRFCG